MSEWEVVTADCLERLPRTVAGSVDSVVTDPPYLIAFMDKEFDSQDGAHADPRKMEAWHRRWALEALRVLKPGGHLLAFGGTRTSHRLVCAVEDAGFEIRGSIDWFFATGFPKSLNLDGGLGTALKPAHEPIVVARKPLIGTVAENVAAHGTGALNIDASRVPGPGWARVTTNRVDMAGGGYGQTRSERMELPGPQAMPEVGRWPADVVLVHSPACVRRGTRTVAANSHWPEGSLTGYGGNLGAETGGRSYDYVAEGPRPAAEEVEDWSCAEGCPVAELDRQSGVTTRRPYHLEGTVPGQIYGDGKGLPKRTAEVVYDDTGGASRFFPVFSWDTEEVSLIYEPKAARSEREAGLPPGAGTTEGPMAGRDQPGLRCRRCGRWKSSGSPCECPEPDFEQVGFDRPAVANTHPTVKPIAMMRWLVRLVTPPAGLVLDPFAGSGSTGCAAVVEGLRFVGIEREAAYADIARKRIAHWGALPPSRAPGNVLTVRAPRVTLDRFSEAG